MLAREGRIRPAGATPNSAQPPEERCPTTRRSSDASALWLSPDTLLRLCRNCTILDQCQALEDTTTRRSDTRSGALAAIMAGVDGHPNSLPGCGSGRG